MTSPQNVREQAQAWLAADPDPKCRAELEALLARSGPEVEAELHDRFFMQLEFGTAGLRGILGAGPNRMNRAVVRRTTLGLARHLLATVPNARERGVVLGRDGRRLSPEFLEDAAGVLTAQGFKVFVFEGVAATPLVAHAVPKLNAAAGVMVTASHNPPAYNGYKVYAANGAQIIPPDDALIARAIEGSGPANGVPVQLRSEAGALWQVAPPEVLEGYHQAVRALLTDAAAARAQLRVAYTPLHGVGDGFVHEAARRAGIGRLVSVPEQAEPDGEFPTVAFPNPEEKGAMDRVIALAQAEGADLALANDPDADRLCVAAREPSGAFRLLTGNEVGILLGHDVLTRPDGPPMAKRLVVTTLVSSSQLGVIAKALGAPYEETLTGFKWLANRGLAHEAAGTAQFAFGFEEALGYSVGQVARDKDGVGALVVICDLAARCKAEGRTLLGELERIQRRFGLFVASQKNVTMPGADGAERIRGLMAALRKAPLAELAGRRVRATSDVQLGTRTDAAGTVSRLTLPASDVVTYELEGDARVICRPSGTEPKIKFYFEHREPLADAESVDAARARGLAALEAMTRALSTRLGLG